MEITYTSIARSIRRNIYDCSKAKTGIIGHKGKREDRTSVQRKRFGGQSKNVNQMSQINMEFPFLLIYSSERELYDSFIRSQHIFRGKRH